MMAPARQNQGINQGFDRQGDYDTYLAALNNASVQQIPLVANAREGAARMRQANADGRQRQQGERMHNMLQRQLSPGATEWGQAGPVGQQNQQSAFRDFLAGLKQHNAQRAGQSDDRVAALTQLMAAQRRGGTPAQDAIQQRMQGLAGMLGMVPTRGR
jgi:hypothetical protein